MNRLIKTTWLRLVLVAIPAIALAGLLIWWSSQQFLQPVLATRKQLLLRAPLAVRPSLPPPQGKVEIRVDLTKLNLTVYANGQPYKKYPIAIGKWRTPTPVGEFIILDKVYMPGGPFGSRWLGLNVPWGEYGIHGTNHPGSIGWAASAGCIRMYNEDVAELYEWVTVGTRVIIEGYAPEAEITKTLRRGDTGEQVQYLQYRLRQAGFHAGPLDGWFGPQVEGAVLQLQRFYELPETGAVGVNELYVLGLR